MKTRYAAFAAVTAVAALATVIPVLRADLTVTLDKLDPPDGLPMPPSNLVVVDVFIDVTPGDAWSGTGILADAHNGAELAYAYDPNGVVPTAPGVDNRFVTFFSRPRERDADMRFGSGGRVFVIGALYGAGAYFSPTGINAAVYYPGYEWGRDGFILRIALDLSAVSDPRFRLDSENIVVSTTQLTDGVALFETFSPTGFDDGLLITSGLNPNGVWSGFGIYGIPEPASGIMLMVGAAWLIRRRGA